MTEFADESPMTPQENDATGPEGEELTPENAPVLQAFIQMRIYDVLVAILNRLDPESADLIMKAHDQGWIVTGPPTFAGFATPPDESDDADVTD